MNPMNGCGMYGHRAKMMDGDGSDFYLDGHQVVSDADEEWHMRNACDDGVDDIRAHNPQMLLLDILPVPPALAQKPKSKTKTAFLTCS